MTAELKPCPFCGKNDLRVNYFDIDGWSARIMCDRCDGEVSGPDSEYKYDDKEDAASDATARWNARPPAPQHISVGASIVPPHCSGSVLGFEPGALHVNKDGSGYITVNEDEFVLEDDRTEGPDGPEGSVHWIVRLDASEMVALRDFLNGAPAPAELLVGGEDWAKTWHQTVQTMCVLLGINGNGSPAEILGDLQSRLSGQAKRLQSALGHEGVYIHDATAERAIRAALSLSAEVEG